MTESSMEQVELKIETAKAFIQRKKTLLKLMETPLFKELINENYFKEEASRLVMYKASPTVSSDPKEQYSIDRRIDAIGFLQQFFISVIAMGNQAEKTLHDDEQTRNELENEEQTA